MDDLIVGIVALGIGAAVCLAGLRVFFLMLPIWGFFAGFFVGAIAIEAIFGDGFLSTVSGWVVGFFVGVAFSLLSYLYWYVGAIVAAGSAGALIGSGLMAAFDVDAGWIVFLVALAFALAAIVLALPVYVVVVNTALAGAAAIVAGAMLVLDRVELDELGQGSAVAMIEESWFWTLAWVALAVFGIVVQLRWVEGLVLPEDRWARAQDDTGTASMTRAA